MNKFYLFLFIVSLLPLSFSDASADLVSFPTGDAAWTVDVTPDNTPSSSAPAAPGTQSIRQVKRAEVTQLGDVKRIVITWSDGKTTEKWSIPKLPVTFEEDPRNGVVTPFLNGGPTILSDNFYLTYDSFAFDWISPQALKEKDPIYYQGKQCFHYEASVPAPMQKFALKKEAWIDATTLLPVALDNGNSLSIFKFQEKPPTGPLTMPPAFEHAVSYYKLTMGYK
jgi:hypothetical protein